MPETILPLTARGTREYHRLSAAILRSRRLRVLSAALCAAPDLTPQGADLMVRLDYAAQRP